VKVSEAKKVVASYLTGGRIGRQELEDACDTLNRGEPRYVGFLREEMGLPLPITSLCDVVIDRAAEYGLMSPDARRTELPELGEHMATCAECKAFYREVYLSAFAAGMRRVGQGLRRLAEPIRLLMPESGGLRPVGLGPEDLAPAPAVGSLMGPRAVAGESTDREQRTWSIPLDEDSGLAIELRMRSRGDKVELNLALQGRSAETAADMTFECGGVHGRVRDFQVTTIKLSPGVSTLRLKVGDEVRWEIPLILDQEED
jgi:hypothetical protein